MQYGYSRIDKSIIMIDHVAWIGPPKKNLFGYYYFDFQLSTGKKIRHWFGKIKTEDRTQIQREARYHYDHLVHAYFLSEIRKDKRQ